MTGCEFQTWNSKGIKLEDIKKLWLKGLGSMEIARTLGCTTQNILAHLKKLGLYDKAEVAKRALKEQSKAMKEVRKRIPNPVKRPEIKEKIRRTVLDLFKTDPTYRQRISEGMKKNTTPQQRRNISSEGGKAAMRKLKAEGRLKQWHLKGRMASHRRPNKLETDFAQLLDKHLPNEFRYVGGGNFWVARMNPDFIHNNGKKKVIELFGDYWHKPEEEQQRIEDFKQHGYDCLILWEHEIKELDESEIVARVERFDGL